MRDYNIECSPTSGMEHSGISVHVTDDGIRISGWYDYEYDLGIDAFISWEQLKVLPWEKCVRDTDDD
jgi:hypothetical protein